MAVSIDLEHHSRVAVDEPATIASTRPRPTALGQIGRLHIDPLLEAQKGGVARYEVLIHQLIL